MNLSIKFAVTIRFLFAATQNKLQSLLESEESYDDSNIGSILLEQSVFQHWLLSTNSHKAFLMNETAT